MGAWQKAFPIQNGVEIPRTEGGRAYQHTFDFRTATREVFNRSLGDLGISAIKSVFVDNSDSSATTFLEIPGIGEIIAVPAYSQGIFPYLSTGLNLQVDVTSAGAVEVPVLFLNLEFQFAIWSVSSLTPGGTTIVSGTVTVEPALGAFTNRSGAIALGGTSQTLAAANGSRKRLIIQNPASAAGQNIGTAEALYINFTSAAGVNDGTSIELQPGGSFDTATGPCTSELITVVAATASHRFIAKEM